MSHKNKLLIEGGCLYGQRTGVGQYVKRLLEAMANEQSDWDYKVFSFNFFNRRKLPKVFDPEANISQHFIYLLPGKIYTKLLKHGINLPINWFIHQKADLVWFPNFVAWPISKRIKTILTVYDISFVTHGQYTHPPNRKYLLKFVPLSIARATHVVTISENAKREITKHYKLPSESISVVYPAVDHSFFYKRPQKEINKVRLHYKLPEKYILYTGTIEPRKNIDGLLNAYMNLHKNILEEFSLVLVGGKGWLDDKIESKIKDLQTKGMSIYRLGYIPDADLPAIYSGATLFVYPSFYEGFGMPPLEAMACGVPVITSDNSSLPEVIGEAGIMVEANDEKALTSAITKVLSDPKLQTELQKKGHIQSQKFTWKSSAQKMLDIINAQVYS